ncbi:MAG: 50S ribosomal protein L29 [Immundisolibacterales bacterium]|nr:50S ribosomal protein L29 [Immundisolibacterales bacterium]
MNIGEIRGQDSDALGDEILKLRREAFRLRMQRATGQDVASSRVRDIRHTIARIKTVLGERRRAAAGTNGGARA